LRPIATTRPGTPKALRVAPGVITYGLLPMGAMGVRRPEHDADQHLHVHAATIHILLGGFLAGLAVFSPARIVWP
jgi:hypothetical protein